MSMPSIQLPPGTWEVSLDADARSVLGGGDVTINLLVGGSNVMQRSGYVLGLDILDVSFRRIYTVTSNTTVSVTASVSGTPANYEIEAYANIRAEEVFS